MKTTEPRDTTWSELQETALCGMRTQIWDWLKSHGPATTRQMAQRMGLPLLNVRPRVCELAVLGFAECIGKDGHEGRYRAIPLATRQARHEAETREEQLSLNLP